MQGEPTAWSLVLAAGDGTRLRSLTTSPSGTAIPKQFCSLRGGPSLLHEALCRAREVTANERTSAVVAAQHRQWWQPQLRSLSPENIIVQPQNRGTGNGILLPLLNIMERDRDARIVLLPSDHHVREEAILIRSLRQALERSRWWRPDETVLLGLEPEEPDPGLGYIIGGRRVEQGAWEVAQFVEKPTVDEARELIKRGGLWNAFIVVSPARALLTLFQRRVPGIVAQMQAAARLDFGCTGASRAMAELYDRLPVVDFSRDIVPGQEGRLRVLAVPPCGWSDLGTPDRVARVLCRAPSHRAEPQRRVGLDFLSLAEQYERQKGTLAIAREAQG